MPCNDGSHLIILNSEYDREKKNIELPIAEFLSIIKGVESNYSSMLARDVSERIIEIKNNHAKEHAYMTLDELIQDEKDESFEEGMAQGVAKVLELLGVSEEEYQQILQAKSKEDSEK